MKQINHKTLKSLITKAYDKKLPLFIWGAFGIGKSAVVKSITQELGINFIDVRLSQLEPSDLRGLPTLQGNTTKWLPPSWLPSDKESKGILFFDEINLSPPSIQASCYQIILDRKLGDYELPNGWIVISAGNRIEDKASVFEIPTPLANRFLHTELLIPTIEDWCEWGLKNNMDNRVMAFLNFKPSRLFSFDSKSKDKSIPTPRSWDFCSKIINEVDSDEELELLVSSCVGEGTAIEFMAFHKLTKKIDVEDLLKNPKKIKDIKELDLKYSIISSITEYYRKHKDIKTIEKVFNVAEQFEIELGVLLLRFVKAIDETFFMKECLKSKETNNLLQQYSKYLV